MTDNMTDDQDICVAFVKAVSPAASKAMMRARPDGLEGRSRWQWFTMSNGDVVFGCYPCGDTFEALRGDMV